HDGTDFDAAAAKWNIERILDPEVHSWVQPYYTAIDRVEAVDKYTLRVHMKEPFGSLDKALAGYFQGIPMASPKSFATYGKDWVQHPTGTGPFILKEWSPGEIDFIARVPIQQVLVLEKSPGIRLATGPSMAPTVALLNLRVKPFDDVRARRAVGGYGIDRAEIAKVGF